MLSYPELQSDKRRGTESVDVSIGYRVVLYMEFTLVNHARVRVLLLPNTPHNVRSYLVEKVLCRVIPVMMLLHLQAGPTMRRFAGPATLKPRPSFP